MGVAADTPSNRSAVRLRPNERKIIESVLFLIEESDRHRLGSPTQYDIAKALFVADIAHLNEYGRPVTYDNYCAMTDGPVPSYTYDLLKKTRDAQAKADLPWEIIEEGKKMYFVGTKRTPDLRALSKSDCDALSSALKKVRRMKYNQIRRLTHEHPAYIEAWREDETRRSFPMKYELLLDSRDLDAAFDLEYISKHK